MCSWVDLKKMASVRSRERWGRWGKTQGLSRTSLFLRNMKSGKIRFCEASASM